MIQAIAGVAPPETSEVTVMIVYPSVAATGFGRFLGRQYALKTGFGWLTLGHLIALASIPLVVPNYFLLINPFTGRRYRLTNRRLIIERGVQGHPEQWVELDRFDSVTLDVQPGQEWYPAGNLIFRKGQIETFRLLGVRWPETFRRTILKTAQGYLGARAATG
jgi:hypothetical protein